MPSGFRFREQPKKRPQQQAAQKTEQAPQKLSAGAATQHPLKVRVFDPEVVESIRIRLEAAFGANRHEVTRLAVEGKTVPVSDLQHDYAALLLQLEILPSYGVPDSPMAAVVRGGAGALVPFDYGLRHHDPTLDDILMPMSTKVARAYRLMDTGLPLGAWIEESGLSIEYMSHEDALSNFMTAAAHEVMARAGVVGASSDSPGPPENSIPFVDDAGNLGPPAANVVPPSHLFRVTTNTPKLRVAISRGHFISTHRFFGQSTPAVSYLSQGFYMLGIYERTGPRFPEDGLLVEVPYQLSYDLEF